MFTPADLFTELARSGPDRVKAATTARVDERLAPTGIERLCAKNEVIFGEGDAATSYYRVASGTVRSCKFLGDGRRQIAEYHVAGEFFGIEFYGEHQLGAEAVSRAKVVSFPRQPVDSSEPANSWLARNIVSSAPANGWLARNIVSSALLNLDRARGHATLLGRKSAPERVATFLLDVSERVRSDSFYLPMPRIDIADYLGLTIETVSRTLTQFAKECVISLPAARRDIVLLNKAVLCRLREGSLPEWCATS